MKSLFQVNNLNFVGPIAKFNGIHVFEQVLTFKYATIPFAELHEGRIREAINFCSSRKTSFHHKDFQFWFKAVCCSEPNW